MYLKSWKKKIISVLLSVGIICGCGFYGYAEESEATAPPEVSAHAYILMEASTKKVLASGNERERLPMASTTKIMTALLTLEKGDLDTDFTVDNRAIMVEGSSMGLRPDDTVSMRDLCYGMLLSSGNDAANLAAVKIAGSQEEFAVLMNERAAQIGMADTNFVTPSGLHDDNHYSTAYDMALLAVEALKNSDFLEICGQQKAKLSFGNPPYDRWLSNHNKMLKTYQDCIGLKTGFTKKAGRCLVSAAERDGVRLVCVTLNAPNDWQDHTKLLDYGFSVATAIELPTDFGELTVSLVGAEQEQLVVSLLQPVTAVVTEDELSRVESKLLLHPFYYAPIGEGDVVGTVNYFLDGQQIGEGTLVAAQSVERKITEIQHPGVLERMIRYFKALFLK